MTEQSRWRSLKAAFVNWQPHAPLWFLRIFQEGTKGESHIYGRPSTRLRGQLVGEGVMGKKQGLRRVMVGKTVVRNINPSSSYGSVQNKIPVRVAESLQGRELLRRGENYQGANESVVLMPGWGVRRAQICAPDWTELRMVS